MSAIAPGPSAPPSQVDFRTAPERYRHWRLEVEGRVVRLLLVVDERAGRCFAGTLLETAFAADQTFMLDGRLEGDAAQPARVALTDLNFDAYPGLTGTTWLGHGTSPRLD